MNLAALPSRIKRRLLSHNPSPQIHPTEVTPSKEAKYLAQISQVMERMPGVGVVYDIGANNGIWAQAFAIITQSPVYAFEPIHQLADEIAQRAQKFPQINVVNAACGDREGKDVIHRVVKKHEASSLLPVSELGSTEFAQYNLDETEDEEIEIVTLDGWKAKSGAPNPDLIKVDVQGYEHKVLAGGEQTFKTAKYLWLELNFKEFYEGSSTFNNLLPKLHAMGFELIDCIDLVRSQRTGDLLYMDGIFANTAIS